MSIKRCHFPKDGYVHFLMVFCLKCYDLYYKNLYYRIHPSSASPLEVNDLFHK